MRLTRPVFRRLPVCRGRSYEEIDALTREAGRRNPWIVVFPMLEYCVILPIAIWIPNPLAKFLGVDVLWSYLMTGVSLFTPMIIYERCVYLPAVNRLMEQIVAEQNAAPSGKSVPQRSEFALWPWIKRMTARSKLAALICLAASATGFWFAFDSWRRYRRTMQEIRRDLPDLTVSILGLSMDVFWPLVVALSILTAAILFFVAVREHWKHTSAPRFRTLRRTAQIGEIVGLVLVIGFGLTDDLSGMPYIVAGGIVLALSFAVWLYCVVAERRASRQNAAKQVMSDE